MTENKAQTLLTDWAMSLIEPDHIPSHSSVNAIAGESTNLGKHAYRSDVLLYKGGETLQDYRENISRMLKREMTALQLNATFLYFAVPKNKYISVARALECNHETVSAAVKKAITLVKSA